MASVDEKAPLRVFGLNTTLNPKPCTPVMRFQWVVPRHGTDTSFMIIWRRRGLLLGERQTRKEERKTGPDKSTGGILGFRV